MKIKYLCVKWVVLGGFLITSFIFHTPLQSQTRKGYRGNKFTPQFFLGIRGGMNLTAINSSGSYQVFRSIDQTITTNRYQKQYSDEGRWGTSVGAFFAAEFLNHLQIVFTPSYHTYRFSYDTETAWSDAEGGGSFLSQVKHKHTLQYLELPVMLRYIRPIPVGGRGQPVDKLQAYVQAGWFYGRNLDARKELEVFYQDQTQGGVEEIRTDEVATGIRNQINDARHGAIGGLGVLYRLGNLYAGLEVNYKYGFNNLTNGVNRFQNQVLVTGYYDALDDLEASHFEFLIQLVFPLKYSISSDVKLIND